MKARKSTRSILYSHEINMMIEFQKSSQGYLFFCVIYYYFLKNDSRKFEVLVVKSLILNLIVRDYILPVAEETLDRREVSS
jgi:hypothetical protein